MTLTQQALHETTYIRIRPLFVILMMHVLFFLALSRSTAPQTDKNASRSTVTFLAPVMPQTDPSLSKKEHEKAEYQAAKHQEEKHQTPPPSVQKESVQPPRTTLTPASAEKLPAPPAAKSFAEITANVETDSPGKTGINLNQLRSQATLLAKESAQNEASEAGYTGILGDYYGSYNGADTGTFYIHVDHTGNIFGSADSGTAHSSFTITGKVSTNGVVQMTGKGLAGSASFDGNINLKTGGVAGHWNLTGFGRGQFAGQRAKSASNRAY
ncbi:hypothetical protein [Undibacterium sp. TJN19]|uniref:hypothetical protein n=1 Tax=Undibacterium sp. TJN19 TaxID=3413055 RepID=UPI003BF357A9